MWSVLLAGSFKPYDKDTSDAIENAYQGGSSEVLVTVRGTRYLIALKPTNAMKQKLESDPTKSRAVKRQGPPQQPANRPVAVPAPAAPLPAPVPPAPAPPAPAPSPAPAAAKRKAPADSSSTTAPSKPNKKPATAATSPPPAAPSATPTAPAAAAAAATTAAGASSTTPAPSSTLMAPGSNNFRIHAMLVELADIEKVKGDQQRANTYYKAAHAVKTHTEAISDGKKAAKELKGVGKKIAEKIDELLTTGKLERLERDRADPGAQALKDLQRVSGIGPKFAETLRDTHGIADLSMLSVRSEQLLNHEQQIGLRHLKDFEARIPRSEIEALEAIVQAAAKAHDPPLQVTVCGSYRRGKPSSGDIDCLLCHPSYKEREPEGKANEALVPNWVSTLVDALKASGFLTDVISLGKKKCHAVCRLPEPQGENASASTASEAATEGGGDSGSGGNGGGSDAGGGGSGSGNGGDGDGNARPSAAPPAPVMKLPTMKELLAKKKARQQQSSFRQKTDLFDSWKAGKQPAAPPAGAEGDAADDGGTKADAGGSSGAGGSGGGGGLSVDGGDATKDDAAERRFRRLDLRLVPYECYHASTLYFTGSDEFNKKMRSVAIEKGYKLSEYGLFKVGANADEHLSERPEVAQSEEDIFAMLGMPYASPPERDI